MGHITVRWGEARSDRVVRSLGYNSRSAHRGRLRSGVSKRRVRSQSCVRVWIRFLSVRLSAAVRLRERGDLGFAYRTLRGARCASVCETERAHTALYTCAERVSALRAPQSHL